MFIIQTFFKMNLPVYAGFHCAAFPPVPLDAKYPLSQGVAFGDSTLVENFFILLPHGNRSDRTSLAPACLLIDYSALQPTLTIGKRMGRSVVKP